MKRVCGILVLMVCLGLCLAQAYGQQGAGAGPESLAWQAGPSSGKLGDVAKIEVPSGYRFLDGNEARKLLEMMENPTGDTEVGLVAPTSLDWFVIFEYSAEGYVSDAEKGSLDADAILKSIKESNDVANEERKKRGWAPSEVVGWEKPPAYDPATHNLEWAIKGQSEGQISVNYNTRLLGRGGYMSVTLVADPASLASVMPLYQNLLRGFSYVPGQDYASYRQGDKLAEYGLTALVAGGAGAVAAKAGLFKGLWKLIVLGAAGVAGLFRKLFGRK